MAPSRRSTGASGAFRAVRCLRHPWHAQVHLACLERLALHCGGAARRLAAAARRVLCDYAIGPPRLVHRPAGGFRTWFPAWRTPQGSALPDAPQSTAPRPLGSLCWLYEPAP